MKLPRRKSEQESTVFVCLYCLFLAWGSGQQKEEIGGASRRFSSPAKGENVPAQDLELRKATAYLLRAGERPVMPRQSGCVPGDLLWKTVCERLCAWKVTCCTCEVPNPLCANSIFRTPTHLHTPPLPHPHLTQLSASQDCKQPA